MAFSVGLKRLLAMLTNWRKDFHALGTPVSFDFYWWEL